MEFLKEFSFTDLDIDEIIKYNYRHIIDNMVLNQENIKEIIDYLIGIGIEKDVIKEIFMYQVSLFFKTKEEIKMSFDEYELDSIVKSVNYDVNNIELIDFV